jgi:cytoskeletal protein CcmA (bactofilin family)
MSTGRVEGRLSYKSIAVEHGGVVEGTVVFLNESSPVYGNTSGGSAD